TGRNGLSPEVPPAAIFDKLPAAARRRAGQQTVAGQRQPPQCSPARRHELGVAPQSMRVIRRREVAVIDVRIKYVASALPEARRRKVGAIFTPRNPVGELGAPLNT